MIVEKLEWLRHAGLQIFSLDIQPDGSRFATAGGDHKVRIWSMAVLQNLDQGISQPRLLATLRDHFGSVNCVRWAQGGHLVASGSDDQLVLVHKRHPGSGTTEFGSGEAPDVENWKNILTLRGHSADVVDLGWSPDDSMIASCSLDNTVRIWSSVNGSLISVLQGHQSLVKGVAWDPVGSFLASQSDDKTVIIWHTGKWNAVHKAEGPWEKTVGSTFFRRLAWSPCGHFITTTHGFQEPSHTAPVLERGEWCTSFDFVGHNAPVVAVRYNHSMFRKMPLPDARKTLRGDDSGGGTEAQPPPVEDAPYNVIAMGSQDCNITVWTTASPRPVFVGKHFFSQSVVDLTWSTDGYTLLCCSLDGTVATFSFEQKELGLKISKEEMEDFKKTRYGDVQVRRLMLVESPAQLQLEAAAAKQLTISAVAAAEVQPAVREKSLEVLPPNSASDRRQQTEYRGADGRRRIIPKPLGQDFKENEAPDGLKSTVNESFVGPAGLKSVLVNASRPEGKGRGGANADVPPIKHSNGHEIQHAVSQSDYTPMPMDADAPKTLSGTIAQTKLLVQPPASHGGVLSIEVQTSLEAPVCLEARQVEMPHTVGFAREGHVGDNVVETDIVCSQGGKVLWWDRLRRKATILAGNSNLWVVACDDNSIQVYTAAGRRALPPIILSSPAAFMDCDKGWKLLLLSCCGALQIWDLRSFVSVLRESVSAILESSPKAPPPAQESEMRVISARISEAGAPLIVLENQHIYLFHMELKCWVQIADCFPSSRFCKFGPMLTTVMAKGDPSPRRVGALGPDGTFNLSRAGLLGHDNGSFTRGQLEFEMAVAVALQSAEEYRRCLLAYARCLARDADKTRLRELCEELLGPPDVLDSANDPSSKRGWDPLILGLKKRELLGHDVLPAMASNRSIQRLLAEFVDLLVEIEARMKQATPEPVKAV